MKELCIYIYIFFGAARYKTSSEGIFKSATG